MAWTDNLLGAQQVQGLTPEQQKALNKQGLLTGALYTLSHVQDNSGTPLQALAGGLLAGRQSVQQGGEQMVNDQYKNAIQQSQMDTLQRRRALQDLALKFKRPDGSFDMAGYQQALMSVDPQSAMEMQQNSLRQQLVQAQTKVAERQANTMPTRQIEQGSDVLTQEQGADGKWKTIASAPRWNPSGIYGSQRQLGPGAYQIVQGQDGNFYRVNKVTGETEPVQAGDQQVVGSNVFRAQTQAVKNVDAQNAAAGAVQSFDTALGTIAQLKTHPGLGAGTGVTGTLARNVPGTEAYTFGRDVDALKAQVFLPQVQNLRGMGALSDSEGKKVSDAIGALDPAMSKKDFLQHLQTIQSLLEKAKERALGRSHAVNAATGGMPASPGKIDLNSSNPLGLDL